MPRDSRQSPMRRFSRRRPRPQPANAPGTQTITIIDGSSGKRQEVLIAASGDGAKRSAADPRLLEPSRHGPIPKIAADGARAGRRLFAEDRRRTKPIPTDRRSRS